MYRFCQSGPIAFSVLIDEPTHPSNHSLHLPIITLSIPEDKECSKTNGLVKVKVPERVTSGAAFAFLRDFVFSVRMK